MIRGVILDLDGTLGDTLPVCFLAFRRVLRRRLGRGLTEREILGMFGPSEEGILRSLCPDDADVALGEYLDEYRLAHERCPAPFDGMRECLDVLRSAGVQLAVVTGKGPHSARISLEVFGLEDRFSVVEAGSPEGGVKPQAMRRVLERWRLDPSRAVGVGDSPSDIRSAQAVGISSVAAAWASTASARDLAACGPDWLFDGIPGFRSWIESTIVADQSMSMQSP